MRKATLGVMQRVLPFLPMIGFLLMAAMFVGYWKFLDITPLLVPTQEHGNQ